LKSETIKKGLEKAPHRSLLNALGLAKKGDVVTILGMEKDKIIDAQELAIISNTIPYEILTGFGSAKRLRSVYKFEGKILNDPILDLSL